MDIVGLIPAAGLGSRISPLPFSKELYPVGFGEHPETGEPHPKPVAQYLLEQMQEAGAETAYFILRKGKWDIPAYFGDGAALGFPLGYLLMNKPYGTPFSVDQAYTFVKDKRVVFGFPDIMLEPKTVLKELLEHQQEKQADVVLATFEVQHPHKWDMVAVGAGGEVHDIVPKPETTELTQGWAAASWGPAFTEFMHQHLQQLEATGQTAAENFELSLGAVIKAAIGNGLQVHSVCFQNGNCLDVGTPEDLRQAIRSHT